MKKNIDNSISDNGEFMKSIDGLPNTAEEKRQSLFDNTMFVCEKYNTIKQKDNWISIKEKSPNKDEWALVCYDNYLVDDCDAVGVVCAYYDGELWHVSNKFAEPLMGNTGKVTHWMYLPQIPHIIK